MVSQRERQRLRDLAKRVAEIAALPVMEERRQMWIRHNELERVRPMILVFPEGSWRELVTSDMLQCQGEEARAMERALLQRIYQHEHIFDDSVIESSWTVRKVIRSSGWGLQPRHKPSSDPLGAWAFDPVIHEPKDLEKIKFPVIEYDEKQTRQNLEQANDLFGDILDVRLRGVQHISFHLMNQYCQLRGLEQVMWDMHDRPQMVHDAMTLLAEGHRRLVQQYVEQGLLSLNNDGTYHSSGGVGYTIELPKPGCTPGQVRPCDMWASAESQEMATVSPKMHYEFVMQYEKRLLEPFGLNGYGCCEDLTRKLDYVLSIPNMRRISISPFADVEQCAAKLGNKAIFSWKPRPDHLVGGFDPDRIRSYIKRTLDLTGDCVIEMILKDTHTCENQPQRFTSWTQIARELAEQY